MIALATTSLVAVAAFALAVHQFILKYLYDQSSYTRTLGGVMFIVLGFAGIGIPIILLRNRQLFLSLRPSRQWLLAGSIPLVHLLVMAGCLEAAQRSTTILLPRPFTPTAIVHYHPGNSRIEFRGGWRPDIGPSGSSDAVVQPDGSEKFSSHLAISRIRRPFAETETVVIVGRAKREHDDSVHIVLEVHAKESIRFAVENLSDARIMRDGLLIGEADSQSGTFNITITGDPKQDYQLVP